MIGGIVGALVNKSSGIKMVEDVGVAVFGAFIGGEFLVAQFRGAATPDGDVGLSIGMSVVGAVGMLAMLGLLRRTVGPMRAGKSRARNR